MHVILVYDTAAERNPKALRTCRRYLHWAQRSVFEGELSDAQLRRLRKDLDTVLEPTDSVIVYTVDQPTAVTRHVWGRDSGTRDSII